MKKFTFHWLDGTREVLIGKTPQDAFTKAGYGAGALSALDFVANGEDYSYTWENGRWNKNVKQGSKV